LSFCLLHENMIIFFNFSESSYCCDPITIRDANRSVATFAPIKLHRAVSFWVSWSYHTDFVTPRMANNVARSDTFMHTVAYKKSLCS